MGARRSGSPRQPRPVKTGWDWRPPRKPQPPPEAQGLAVSGPASRLAGRVAQELIPRLLSIKRYGEAIALTRRRLATDRDFRPVTAAETLQMVRLARDGGDRPTARSLLRDFERIFPNDPLQAASDELTSELER